MVIVNPMKVSFPNSVAKEAAAGAGTRHYIYNECEADDDDDDDDASSVAPAA
nr:hypothetical protein Itr_chr04CG07200 [Ipomoea trifida]